MMLRKVWHRLLGVFPPIDAQFAIAQHSAIPQPPIPTRLALPPAPIELPLPPIHPKWNCYDPALLAQLRPGTVLESYDCGYFRILEISADGIILPGGLGTGRLMTWADLIKLECLIYSQPAEGEDWRHTPTPPFLREFGGRFEQPSPAVLTEIDRLARAEQRRCNATIGVKDVCVAIIAELIRLAPEQLKWTLRLNARWLAFGQASGLPETLEILPEPPETISPSIKLTARLALLVTVLYDGQGLGPTKMELDLARDEHGHRFEARLSYD